MSEPAAASGATFDELLEHLDDLIQFAANEGYLNLAQSLEHRLLYARERPDHYGRRELSPGADARAPLRRST